MAERWEDLEVVRDAEGDLDEIWVAVSVAPTPQAAEDRARRVYGPDHWAVPIASERGWMHVRAANPADPEEAFYVEDLGLTTIVAPCEEGDNGAREFWTVLAVDPSEVGEYARYEPDGEQLAIAAARGPKEGPRAEA